MIFDSSQPIIHQIKYTGIVEEEASVVGSWQKTNMDSNYSSYQQPHHHHQQDQSASTTASSSSSSSAAVAAAAATTTATTSVAVTNQQHHHHDDPYGQHQAAYNQLQHPYPYNHQDQHHHHHQHQHHQHEHQHQHHSNDQLTDQGYHQYVDHHHHHHQQQQQQQHHHQQQHQTSELLVSQQEPTGDNSLHLYYSSGLSSQAYLGQTLSTSIESPPTNSIYSYRQPPSSMMTMNLHDQTNQSDTNVLIPLDHLHQNNYHHHQTVNESPISQAPGGVDGNVNCMHNPSSVYYGCEKSSPHSASSSSSSPSSPSSPSAANAPSFNQTLYQQQQQTMAIDNQHVNQQHTVVGASTTSSITNNNDTSYTNSNSIATYMLPINNSHQDCQVVDPSHDHLDQQQQHHQQLHLLDSGQHQLHTMEIAKTSLAPIAYGGRATNTGQNPLYMDYMGSRGLNHPHHTEHHYDERNLILELPHNSQAASNASAALHDQNLNLNLNLNLNHHHQHHHYQDYYANYRLEQQENDFFAASSTTNDMISLTSNNLGSCHAVSSTTANAATTTTDGNNQMAISSSEPPSSSCISNAITTSTTADTTTTTTTTTNTATSGTNNTAITTTTNSTTATLTNSSATTTITNQQNHHNNSRNGGSHKRKASAVAATTNSSNNDASANISTPPIKTSNSINNNNSASTKANQTKNAANLTASAVAVAVDTTVDIKFSTTSNNTNITNSTNNCEQNGQNNPPNTASGQQSGKMAGVGEKRKRGRRRQHAVADQSNSLERVFIWDLDGTLIVYQYLLSSYYASIHSLDTSCAERLQALGTRIQEMVCNFCDERLFYQDLKGIDYMHIDDQNCEEAKSMDLSKYDFISDGFAENKTYGSNHHSMLKYLPTTTTTPNNNGSNNSNNQLQLSVSSFLNEPIASANTNTINESDQVNIIQMHNHHHLYSPYQTNHHLNEYNSNSATASSTNNAHHNSSSYSHQWKSANIEWSRKLSFRYQRIKEIYEQFRTPIHIQDIIRFRRDWMNVINDIDTLTAEWRLRAMDCLRLIAESPNCTNVIVTKSPLVFALGQILCYGLGEYFPVDQIYSSHKVPKEACIRRIIKRFGPTNRCSYIVIGGDQEVELAKKVDLPFWRVTCNDGHQQLSQLYRALKDGFLL